MKTRILAFALVCFAISAFAGSINWGFTGINKNTTLIEDFSGNPYSGDIYLILATNASSLEGLTSKTEFEDALGDITLGTAEVTAGKISSSQTATHDSLIAKVDGGPNTYSFQVVVYDASNLQYYLSGTAEKNAYSLEGVAANTDAATTITFTKTMIGKSATSASSWSQAVTIPEPSVALMGLLGLGMLLKRRKA